MAGSNWTKGRHLKGWHGSATMVLFVTLGLAGCGQEAAQDAQSFQVRDSAGVTIADNSAGEWTEATAWTLSSEPILTIGEFEGPEEYLLFRANGARRLSNGNVVIANSGTYELRFYDPSGTHIRSVGGEGDGPGDFRYLEQPWALGSDSIVVWDTQSARLTVFDVDGELGRSFRLDPIPGTFGPDVRGIIADNSLLVTAIIQVESPVREGLFRNSILYARFSLEGDHMATTKWGHGNQAYSLIDDTGLQLLGRVQDAHNPAVTVFGNQWYYGSSDSWEIEVYSPDGALTHLFRRDEPNRPFSPEIEDEDPELAQGPVSARRAARARFLASLPIPETLPAYRSFIAGDDGSLWVENYTRPNEQPSWAVFRDDGRYLGAVETPMGAQVTHIGDDFVLVIWEDDLEVQQVQMYELIQP